MARPSADDKMIRFKHHLLRKCTVYKQEFLSQKLIRLTYQPPRTSDFYLLSFDKDFCSHGRTTL